MSLSRTSNSQNKAGKELHLVIVFGKSLADHDDVPDPHLAIDLFAYRKEVLKIEEADLNPLEFAGTIQLLVKLLADSFNSPLNWSIHAIFARPHPKGLEISEAISHNRYYDPESPEFESDWLQDMLRDCAGPIEDIDLNAVRDSVFDDPFIANEEKKKTVH